MGIIFAQTDITPFPPKESIGIIKLSFPDKTLKSVSLVLFITCAIFSKEGFASFSSLNAQNFHSRLQLNEEQN